MNSPGCSTEDGYGSKKSDDHTLTDVWSSVPALTDLCPTDVRRRPGKGTLSLPKELIIMRCRPVHVAMEAAQRGSDSFLGIRDDL